MSTLNTPTVGSFTAKEVARVVDLDLAALSVLGVPVAGDLTRDDLAALMAELRRRGYGARVYSLEVFLRQRKEVPSRVLIPAAAKHESPVRHPWQDRKDIAG